MKKLLLILMILGAAIASMSAQDEPVEQTANPYITLELIEGSYDCYYAVTIYNSDEDPEADLFYRYSLNGEEFSEWRLYDDVLFFEMMGTYIIECYAKAEGKSPSDILVEEFIASEPTHNGTYDFKQGGIYYKWLSDSTVAVTYKSDEWIAYPYASGKESYSGFVEIPETVYHVNGYTVTHIGNLAFWDCSLTGVTLPNTITTIEYQAFMASTLDSIYIPASVVNVDPTAFSGCNHLVSLQVDENNPVYDSRDNCNAIIETATNTMVCATLGTVIPSSVTAIGDYCFGSYPQGLYVASIVIPDQVVSIGTEAFMFCTRLKDVKFGNSVTSIGARAFNLTAIENLVLPASVATISEHAFSYCDNLKTVVCKAIVPPAAATVFDGHEDPYGDQDVVYHEAVLFVPNESLEAYRAHEEWGKFTHIAPFIGAGPGDVDGDGVIGITDLTIMIDLILAGDAPAYCDVDGDGVASISDLTILIDMILSGN